MKNFKYLLLFFSIVILSSCESNDDMKYGAEVERGWIQFMDGTPDVYNINQETNGVLSLPLNLQVPTTSKDLKVNFSLESISGPNPNDYFDNFIIVPEGITSFSGPTTNAASQFAYDISVDFDLSKIEGVLTSPMVFDVIITGTDSNIITAGLEGEGHPLVKTITICPSFEIDATSFTGSYGIAASSDSALGGSVLPPGYSVNIFATGENTRIFSFYYLSAYLMDFEFEVNGGYITPLVSGAGVGCGSEILLGPDSSNPYSYCDESEIVLNMLEFYEGSGSCGASDNPVSITLIQL